VWGVGVYGEIVDTHPTHRLERRMDELFESRNIKCMVGCIMSQTSDTRIPLFLADYGREEKSLFDLMLRYRKVSLDIVPVSAERFTYIVAGDKIIAEFDPKTADRAFQESTPEAMIQMLMAKGRPEFAISFDSNAEGHGMFIGAREEMMGSWVLVLLAEDGTELIINPHNVIVSRSRKPRLRYE